MLVKIKLYGSMGKEFGSEWNLAVSTPQEALSLIDANVDGRLIQWMRTNLNKYRNYKVLCIFKNGKREYLTKDTLLTARNIVEVRFTPLIQGAGAAGRIIAGVVLMVAAIWLGPVVFQVGLSLTASGVTELLAPKSKTGTTKTSKFFQGATNTVEQGGAVPLIYGRCKVGSLPVSTKLTVGELSVFKDENKGFKSFLYGSSNDSASNNY